MTNKPLLLTGANGRTGRAILRALVKQGVPVRAFIRNQAQAALAIPTSCNISWAAQPPASGPMCSGWQTANWAPGGAQAVARNCLEGRVLKHGSAQ